MASVLDRTCEAKCCQGNAKDIYCKKRAYLYLHCLDKNFF